jgi:hypothetical protein
MIIKMLTRYAGPLGNKEPGQLVELPDKEAEQLIKEGYAVKIEEKAKPVDNKPEVDNKPKKGEKEKATNKEAEKREKR